jgi:TRAP-type C4-dicarboxylate transport system permease small subunit
VPSIDLSARTIGAWLRRRSENLAVLMLAVMFVAFILQIVFRYLLDFPIGWTSELTIIMWLWLVLWGAAFVLRESEEIRFDLLQASVGRRARRAMGVIAAVALLLLYGGSLPATIDYVAFMKVERSAYLGIRFDWLYVIYPVFAIAILVRYLWLLGRLLRGKEPERETEPTVGSGL